MAPTSIKEAIAKVLLNLSGDSFKNFCFFLRDRRDEPRVQRSQVEGKGCLEIADLLVSTFTESTALSVTMELLRKINCAEEAEELEKLTEGMLSRPGTVALNPKADEKHFVDKHQIHLINRVTNVEPKLDELLDKGVILQERYAEIRALPTFQEKMRTLTFDFLKTASKDVFYTILKGKK